MDPTKNISKRRVITGVSAGILIGLSIEAVIFFVMSLGSMAAQSGSEAEQMFLGDVLASFIIGLIATTIITRVIAKEKKYVMWAYAWLLFITVELVIIVSVLSS